MSLVLHQGDYHTVIRIAFRQGGAPLPIETATAKQIFFRKPDGTVVTQTADFTTDGLDGKIEYALADGDLDLVGRWKVQGFIDSPGWVGRSSQFAFLVKDIITP